jgi:hypothetical protein
MPHRYTTSCFTEPLERVSFTCSITTLSGIFIYKELPSFAEALGI